MLPKRTRVARVRTTGEETTNFLDKKKKKKGNFEPEGVIVKDKIEGRLRRRRRL